MVTALAKLHPADRRKFLAQAPHEPGHDVALRPLGGGGTATFIVTASEDSFIEAIMADLQKPDWRTALAARQGVRRGKDGTLELSQPVHRRFHLVLFEAFCRTPGSPRLDPDKIDGMGLVLRREAGGHVGHARLRLPGQSGAVNRVELDTWDGWMSDGPLRRGWLTVAAPDVDPDPDAQNRDRDDAAGAITGLIAARRGARRVVEQVLPMFVAPPEVCEALGRTVLYAVAPVASPELVDTAPPAPNYAASPEAQQMREHLSSYLKPRARQDLPRAGDPLQTVPGRSPPEARLHSFAIFLQQLTVELAAFEPGGTAAELMRLLNQIALPTARDAFGRVTHTTPAGDFVRKAAPILVSGEPNDGGVRMPLEWPAVGQDLGGRITEAALACLATRFAALTPKLPKFHDDAKRYAVRGFLRVRVDPACPPTLVWSNYSEPFRIVPWWDSEGPVARIPLPSVGSLRDLKPNVSFEVPPELANMLNGDPSDLKDGKGDPRGIDIMWICSFSLPAITICAYIVLSIFLGLFNLVFGWLAFIKICIPIPRPK